MYSVICWYPLHPLVSTAVVIHPEQQYIKVHIVWHTTNLPCVH